MPSLKSLTVIDEEDEIRLCMERRSCMKYVSTRLLPPWNPKETSPFCVALPTKLASRRTSDRKVDLDRD